jgi:DNA-binding Lrp family transcriptional regulator
VLSAQTAGRANTQAGITALKACVLIRVRPGRHQPVAEKIARLPGVKDAFPVMGTADIVARLEVKNLKTLTALGTKIGNLKDVITTETLVAAEAE